MRSFFSGALAAAAISAALSSCSDSAKISGTLTGASDADVVVKLLDINHYEVLDTVRTDAAGRYSYKAAVKKGQPEFIYLFYKDVKVASLLLRKGDKVSVESDTAGTFSVSGSDETLKLMEVEKAEAEYSASVQALADKLAKADAGSEEAAALKREITAEYIAYYRSRVKYVLQNTHSMTAIPVLYQVVGGGMPVFGQPTDAIHFSNVADSLAAVYPDSRYVKALRQDADKRLQMLELSSRIGSAESTGFLDLEMPDVNGRKVKLSDVKAKVTMLYFWSSAVTAQTLFNVEEVLPIYNDLHGKGFEIYSVCVDTDKATWAAVVKNQKLPWINVCDGNGNASPALSLYNVGSVPAAYFIVDGALVDAPSVKNAASMRSFVSARL